MLKSDWLKKIRFQESVAELRGRGRGRTKLILCAILRYPFLKLFLRRLRSQSMLNLKGKRAPKKREFLVDVSQKVPKNAFFLAFSFFRKFRKFGQTRVFIVIWEGSENQFGRPNFFCKSAPPPFHHSSVKFLDPRLTTVIVAQTRH